MSTKAIVIGSADVIKLCVIRAVGEFGCSVDVLHLVDTRYKTKLKPTDYYSKYVDNYYFVDKTTNGVIEQFLLDNCTDPNQKPVIFTLDDYSTFVIDNARNALNDHFCFAHLSNGEGLVSLMDKHLQKTLAKSSGMDVVEGWPIAFEQGEFVIPKDIKFPCFIKGLYSYYNSKFIQKKCNNESDLKQLLERCKKTYPHAVYAEEFVEIDKELGVIGVSDGENSIIPAKAELLVMGKGANHGVSMLGRVTPLDPNEDLHKYISSLLSKLQYIGIFNIDFVENKGKLLFVELNFRFAAYGYGVFRAGVNLPALFINLIAHQNNQLKTRFEGNYYYMNEKIAFINVIENSLKWDDYKAMKRKTDFLMVTDPKDSKPIRQFRKNYILKFLRLYIKKMFKTKH